MGAVRKWPRRKVASKRRLIARYRLARPITHESIENRPESAEIIERFKKIAPLGYLPHVDCIVRDDRSVRWLT